VNASHTVSDNTIFITAVPHYQQPQLRPLPMSRVCNLHHDRNCSQHPKQYKFT